VYDYKTGKKYEEPHKDQLELYNATALLLFPEAKESIAADLYLDIGPKATLERKMTRAQVPAVIKKWERRVLAMEGDDVFMARPGEYCNRCNYRKSNGGPCLFG
jgi:CRISPR/Cas system-associated exonuclease Cas4 (RecB family)